MSAVARFPVTDSYGKRETRGKPSALRNVPRLTAYMRYQLALARERVELEIAANAFIRGAWREIRRKAG